MSKHTPAPWVKIGNNIFKDGHNSISSPRICILKNASHPVDQLSPEEMENNGNMILAAPFLLAACREFCRKVEAGEARSRRSYQQMIEAIAIADGKQDN